MYRTVAFAAALLAAAPAAEACNVGKIAGTYVVHTTQLQWNHLYQEFRGTASTCWFVISPFSPPSTGNFWVRCDGSYLDSEANLFNYDRVGAQSSHHQIKRGSTARTVNVDGRRARAPNLCEWEVVDLNDNDPGAPYKVYFSPDFQSLSGQSNRTVDTDCLQDGDRTCEVPEGSLRITTTFNGVRQ